MSRIWNRCGYGSSTQNSLAITVPPSGVTGVDFGDTLGSLVFTVAAAAGVFVLANTSSAAGHDAARIAAWVAMQPKLNGIAAILLLGAVCTLGALRSGVGRYAGVILGVAWLLSVGGLIKSLGPINPTLSGKSLALAAPEGQDRRVPVYTVDMYIHALPFYWQRSLTLVDYRGELALGLSEHAHAAVNSIEAFKQLWIASPDALAVMPTRTYQRLEHEDLPMRVVAQTTIAVIVDRR